MGILKYTTLSYHSKMAQQGQQQSSDSGLEPVWIMALVMIVGYLIWYFEHQHLVSFIFYLNLIQAKLINLVSGGNLLSKEIYLMETLNPASVDSSQLLFLTERVGQYSRYPVIVILALGAWRLYSADLTLKYRIAHDMKTLRRQEQYNWPAIMPVIKEDLVNLDITQGPWAMALSPLEFARKHGLLRKDDAILDNPIPGQEMTAGVRRGDAKRVFTLQLGSAWSGFDHCPPHVRALAAVFIARINRDRDAASKILEVLDQTYSQGKPDYSIAWPTLKKYQNTEIVQEIVGRHAYTLTVMSSLLAEARNDGVVPSAEFLWLKLADRRLWYMLNCVGRQTPYSEVAGPFAHWRAENAMKRRCLAPMIDEAIKALEIAIKEVKLSPKEMGGLEP
jgi:intracellular multiplication protein IcmP